MPLTDCPQPPPKADPKLLGFEPFLPMTRWFSPGELIRSGLKSALSAIFGAYADYREIQAFRRESEPFHYNDDEEIWIDYVADLGDGWDSTYSIARLLAEPTLTIDNFGTPLTTKRGRLLVMGGDQVYPTPTKDEYRNKLVGPYRMALPCVQPASEAPHLFVVPGNHDWYDGLTSFTRQFCLGRWIGGWKTRQTRSYFVLELPHGWYLWGMDVQLGSDIDLPQLEYFRSVGEAMPPGSKLILCISEPAWVYTKMRGPEAYHNLAFFERETIHRFGHKHVVGLGSDLHAYARYESEDGRQRFVSGGGGAYLYPTHQLPTELELPGKPGPFGEETTDTFHVGEIVEPGKKSKPMEAVFPDRHTSRKLALLSLLFPYYNPSFAVFIGSFYLFLSWLIQSASKARPASFIAALADAGSRGGVLAGLWSAFMEFGAVVAHAPASAFALLFMLLIFTSQANAPGRLKLWLGMAHTAVHLIALVVLSWIFATLNMGLILGGLAEDSPVQVALFSLQMLVIGGIVGGAIVGLYFYVTHWFLPGSHANEVLCCQSRPDFKHILRLHIDRDGSLTIHAIGIKHVVRRWRYRPDAGPGEAWFEPLVGTIADRAHLIEPPVRVEPATAVLTAQETPDQRAGAAAGVSPEALSEGGSPTPDPP